MFRGTATNTNYLQHISIVYLKRKSENRILWLYVVQTGEESGDDRAQTTLEVWDSEVLVILSELIERCPVLEIDPDGN